MAQMAQMAQMAIQVCLPEQAPFPSIRHINRHLRSGGRAETNLFSSFAALKGSPVRGGKFCDNQEGLWVWFGAQTQLNRISAPQRS